MKLSKRFDEALVYAVRLHAGQQRKLSGAPYMAHLLQTAGMVLEHGGDEEEAIAALLHDAVEDQGGEPTGLAIRERFGQRVAEIVAGCSDTDQRPKPPWRARKEAFLTRLRDASASVHLVTACDKLDNARSILAGYREHGESVWDHFRGRRDGTLWYLRGVVEILKTRRPSAPRKALVEELDRVVARIERAIADPHSGAVAKKPS